MSKKSDKKSKKHGKAKAKKISTGEYEKALYDLQVELCRLQEWVVKQGVRVIVVFEGRDAAGKGGTIKRILERTSPRVFRVNALPAPNGTIESAGGEELLINPGWRDIPQPELSPRGWPRGRTPTVLRSARSPARSDWVPLRTPTPSR